MAKKKKKSGQTEHQRQKLEDARRFKIYAHRVMELLRQLRLNHVASTISRQNIEQVFSMRSMPVKIDMTRAPLFDKGEKKELQGFIHEECRMKTVKLAEDDDNEDRAVSTADFYEILLPLVALLLAETLPDSQVLFRNSPDAEILKSWAYGNEDEDIRRSLFNRVNHAINTVLGSIIFKISNPTSYYFYFEEIDELKELASGRAGRVARIITREAEVSKLIVNNKARRAFRVAQIVAGKLRWMEAEAPFHPKLNTHPQKKYEVYILDHAVARMFERLDGVHPAVVNYFMNISLIDWDAGWFKGTLLINYEIRGKKLGYFVAEITGNKILIRTFLFLTYNDTFEGELLNRSTGLEKLDKKYLSIDKLSTFLASKISKRSPVGKIFCDANCGHLLDLDFMRDLTDSQVSGNAISAEFLMKYLKKTEED